MATFPGGIYAPAAKSNGQVIQAAWFNDPDAEIIAVENALINGIPFNLVASSGLTVSTGGLRVGGPSTLQALQAGASTFTTLQAGASTLTSLSVSGGSTLGTLSAGASTFTSVAVAQIAFPAVQSASAGANTLDDYEEGVWTPVIGGGGGTSGQTYLTQEARYIKIGSQVWAACNVVLSAKGTITGNVEIQGLPFAAETGALQYYVGSISWTATATAFLRVNGWVAQNTTTAPLFGLTAAATSDSGAALVTADLGNASGFRCLFVYRASN